MSWPNAWTNKSITTRLLLPLSWLVCRVAQTRLNRFEQQKKKPMACQTNAKVIVVGNVVVGGAGKTPFIIWLANQFAGKNIRFGIVSRGYGGKSKCWPQRVTKDSDPMSVGDEPVMLANLLNCPVAVSPKRVEAIACLSEENLDVIISDDGLQHFDMLRDLEIALLDSERMFGNGYCLPAGPLREPKSRLDKVDFVVYNGGQESLEKPNHFNMTLRPICFRSVKKPSQLKALNAFEFEKTFAIAGIGSPKRFFDTLKGLKIDCETKAFADHHQYTEADFNQLTANQFVLMTQKDAVKCQSFANDNWWYLEVAPECDIQLFENILRDLCLAKVSLNKINL